MDKGAWQAAVHGVAKSQIRLSDYHTYTYTQMVYSCVENIYSVTGRVERASSTSSGPGAGLLNVKVLVIIGPVSPRTLEILSSWNV